MAPDAPGGRHIGGWAGSFAWGASLGWTSVSTIFGAEFDFGFASADLFDVDEADLLGIDGSFFGADTSTFMGNVIIQPWAVAHEHGASVRRRRNR